jgi:hypothetical protein
MVLLRAQSMAGTCWCWCCAQQRRGGGGRRRRLCCGGQAMMTMLCLRCCCGIATCMRHQPYAQARSESDLPGSRPGPRPGPGTEQRCMHHAHAWRHGRMPSDLLRADGCVTALVGAYASSMPSSIMPCGGGGGGGGVCVCERERERERGCGEAQRAGRANRALHAKRQLQCACQIITWDEW